MTHHGTIRTAIPDLLGLLVGAGLEIETRRFAARQPIFAADERADLAYLVIDGAVAICTSDDDRDRQVCSLGFRGDLIGIEGTSAHSFSAEAALTDATLAILPRASLERLALSERDIARCVVDLLEHEWERARRRVTLLGRGTPAQRVGTFVMEVASRLDAQGPRVALPLGAEDCAGYLGLSPAWFWKAIQILNNEHLVTVSRLEPLDAVIHDAAALGLYCTTMSISPPASTALN